jgi:hypothetical protein
MLFAPRIAGVLPIRSSPASFVEAFRRRVEAGLLTGKPGSRSNYRVTGAASDRLRVRAEDWRTALAVGLNDLELRLHGRNAVQYVVCYWRWAAYALGLCAVLGAIGFTLLLTTDARAYFARNPSVMIPGLSIDQHVAMAWGMAVFWGFVWPWLLIAMHKRPLRRLVERIAADVDASARAGAS